MFLSSDLEFDRFEHHDFLNALEHRDAEGLVAAVDGHLTLSKNRFRERFSRKD